MSMHTWSSRLRVPSGATNDRTACEPPCHAVAQNPYPLGDFRYAHWSSRSITVASRSVARATAHGMRAVQADTRNKFDLPSSVDVDGGDRWFAVATALLPDASSFWWNGNRDAFLAKAMDEAAAELTAKQGSNVQQWECGALHQLTPTNQTLGTGGPWAPRSPRSPNASTWVNLTGASGHVDDPHCLDQLPLWRTFQTLP